MKKKKLALAIVGLLSVVTLAACSTDKEDLVTMKGGKITVNEFFDEVKGTDAVKQALTNTIIFKVADNEYGDKVKKADVDKTLKETKDQLGDQFEAALLAQGFTEASYKEIIKKNLAYEKMQESHIKIKDEDLKAVWATFHPEVEVQLIGMSDEAKAKEVLEKAKKGDDFGKLAKENSSDASKDDNGKVTFDSTTTSVANEVKEAAYKLKNDEVSDLIPVVTNNGVSEVTSYYIVKMVKSQDKGNKIDPFKEQLTEIATTLKKQDTAFNQEVISKELKKANVKIKDDSLKGVLSGYIEEETKASSTKESKTKESSTKESSTKESKTEESK